MQIKTGIVKFSFGPKKMASKFSCCQRIPYLKTIQTLCEFVTVSKHVEQWHHQFVMKYCIQTCGAMTSASPVLKRTVDKILLCLRSVQQTPHNLSVWIHLIISNHRCSRRDMYYRRTIGCFAVLDSVSDIYDTYGGNSWDSRAKIS